MAVGGNFSACGCGGGSDCPSLTTPIASTGLCLPDGTPLAVVMERDCSGNVAQTGWLNLTTGSYTTGVPPAGTAACGDSRSITVSGVFCDIASDGTVHGLVLVEYHYADDGSIDSARLVDAATGTTYTLQGQLTVCPSGGDDDESPGEAPAARQVVERCGCDDSDGDGIGDIRYVELWSVDTTGLSPAFLIGTYIDGDFDQPYTPVNPVDCQDTGGDESPGEPTQTCAPQIVERCGCDDSDGDGIGDVRYTELWAIDPCGGDAPALLGAWVDGDFDQPYTPVAPVDCIGGDESPGELAAGFEVAPVPLCVIDDATGNVLQNVLAEVVYDQTTGDRTGVRYVDHVTGAPVALPGGTHLGVCPQTGACSNCETLLLCDVDPTSPSTIAGTAASGTLSNGVGWTATGPAPFAPSRQSDGAAWWGLGLFPNTTTPVTTWTFNQPVTAEFSVAMSYVAGTAAGANTVQLPAGAQPLSLPPGYTFDRATAVLSADATVTGCPQIRTPSRETSARFRVTGVTSFALQYLGVRALVLECQVFGNWAFGAVDVSLGGQFLRTTCRDCQGEVLDVTDTTLDGTSPYTPTGIVGVCHPPEAEPCASTVQILRLCDLDPAVEPGDDGKRCAVPFLRHLVHSCDGALAETRDTEMDGTTAYTPVKVVDCGSGGVPALSELLWPQTGIAEDPAGVARQDFVYTVTNPETGEVAEVKLHASSASPGGCGAYDPANPVFNNPTVYTLTLDDAAQEMSTFRLDLLDFDTFEGVTGLSPLPSRVEGDVTWNGSTITANQSNSTAYVYFDSPPAQIAYRYGNTGGGLACTSVRFQGMTLVPDGCCGCGTGDETCRNASTLLMCDLPQDGEPALTVTDTDPTPYYSDPVAAPVTGAQALWAGGTLDLPPGTAPQPGTLGTVNTLAATLTAARPACDDGTATVTVSVLVAQTGPDDACGAAGHLRLFNGTQQVALVVVPNNAPVGWSATLTAAATVPAADVAAGNVAVVMALDAYDSGSCTPDPRTTGWNLSQFTASTVYDQDTCAQQVLANVVSDCDTGEVVGISYTTLDGQAYEPAGSVGQCQPTGGTTEPCRDVSSTLLCDVASQSTITVFDPLNVPGADGWQVTSFTGFNLDAPPQAAMPYDATHPAGNSAYMGARDDLSSGTATVLWTDYDAAPVRWVLTKQFTAPEDGMAVVEAAGFRGDGGARVRINGQDVGLYGQWNQPAVGGSSQVPVTAGPNVIEIEVRDTGGPNTVQGRLDVTMTQTNQFFRQQVTDCETGAVIAQTDTTLDGQPYTVTGTVGQCEQVQTCCPPPAPEARVDLETQLLCILDADGQSTGQVIAEFVYDDQSGDLIETRYKDPTTGDEVTIPAGTTLGACPAQPCGDTELVQLCDLVYSPQAPIPTPAGDFTLTGNVVAANGGTTLWFAQANQVANGVAELTVSGLLPAEMYEFRFKSAWVGPGAPDPAANNAIYLLEILDGTTVLATRTRNTSNGSNAYPGGALTDDLPSLAFIAPATGTVTIRFTDQTTGGAINNRDLYLMPIEVRTAVLTVTSTPFLRRFTFDCDGGLTSTQDLGLDGATPYVVQGEVGSCGSSGDGSSVTAPTGDVVDCEDGSRALLVKVCDAGDESPGEPTPCRDSTTMLVCDIPASTTTEVDADLTDSTGAAAGAPAGWGGPDLAGPYTALWSGGTLTIPATAGPTAQTTAVAGVLTADVPDGCDAATGTLTVSVKVTNNGPAAGQVWDGTLQLKKSGVILADAPFPLSAAVGQTFVRTVSVPVTLADLASGELYVLMGFETYHLGAKGWTAQEFSAVVELEGCEATTTTQILRTVVTDCETGEVVSTSDTTLDGTPYTVTGEVGQCIPADTPAACCPTGETLALCDVADDGTTTAFLRRLTYTPDSVTPAVFDTGLDGATPYTVAGTVGVCPGAPDEPVKVVEQCRCDQTADGVVEYVELIAVAEDGTLTTIGTYDEDFAPYTPVSPVACPVEGAPPAMGVQARRVELAPGGSWSAAGVTLLQSVTAVSHAGNGTVTTTDGDSTLHDGESVTWSVARDTDAALTGPLTITAGTGTVTIAFTTAVTL